MLDNILTVATAPDPVPEVMKLLQSNPKCANCLVSCARQTEKDHGDGMDVCAMNCVTEPSSDPNTGRPQPPSGGNRPSPNFNGCAVSRFVWDERMVMATTNPKRVVLASQVVDQAHLQNNAVHAVELSEARTVAAVISLTVTSGASSGAGVGAGSGGRDRLVIGADVETFPPISGQHVDVSHVLGDTAVPLSTLYATGAATLLDQVTFSVKDTYQFSVDSSAPAVNCQLVAAENNITVPFTVELVGRQCGGLALTGTWIGAMYTQATITCGGIIGGGRQQARADGPCDPSAGLCEPRNNTLLVVLVVLVSLLLLAIAGGVGLYYCRSRKKTAAIPMQQITVTEARPVVGTSIPVAVAMEVNMAHPALGSSSSSADDKKATSAVPLARSVTPDINE